MIFLRLQPQGTTPIRTTAARSLAYRSFVIQKANKDYQHAYVLYRGSERLDALA
ncbi:MAG: hypothetical protein R3A45_12950 [Bdellovibrionota bacterium]